MKRTFLMALLVAAGALCACGSERFSSSPPELVGVWTTQDARYAGRFLEFRRNTIVIGVGSGDFKEHPIDRVYRVKEENWTAYTVSFQEDNQPSELEFRRYADGSIQFTRQWTTWTKKPDSGKD